MSNMIWLLLSIFLGALGQVFLKMASMSVKDKAPMAQFYLSLALNYNVWLGFACYGVSFLIWMRMLTRFDLSYARPMVGLGYIITAVLAMLLLGEKVTPLRWLGILLTVGGIIVLNVSRTGR